MIRLLLSAILLLGAAAPAHAHKLKVFATVEDNAIVGYAFFVGGGRAQGTDWTATNGEGAELARGKTGPDGDYRIELPEAVSSAVTVTIDTREGHIASKTLPAERFGLIAADTTPTVSAAPANAETPVRSAPSDEVLAAMIAAAVQRQIEPLQQQITEMDSRLRYTDIVSAICLILGLAGIGLYIRGRRV